MIVEENLLRGSRSKMINHHLRPYVPPRFVEVRLSYTYIERIRELRVLSRGIETGLKRLENEKRDRKDLILREKTALKAVHIEIRQRERMAFFSEFGIQ